MLLPSPSPPPHFRLCAAPHASTQTSSLYPHELFSTLPTLVLIAPLHTLLPMHAVPLSAHRTFPHLPTATGAALQLSGLGVALGSAPPTPSPDQPPAWGPDVLLSLLSFFQPAPEDSGGSGSNSNSGSGSGSSGSSGGVLELRNVVVDVGGGWGQEGGAGPANGICSSLVWIRHAACAAMPDFNLQVCGPPRAVLCCMGLTGLDTVSLAEGLGAHAVAGGGT